MVPPAPSLPEISVLIPCHNAGRWLRAALESALACEGVGEVIVADDASTDDSAAIAASFGPKVSVLRLPRRGGNAARNAALAAARGEWLQFLDADDYLEPSKIARQLMEGAGDADPADVLYSPVWIETWRNGTAARRDQSMIESSADIWTQWIRWQLPQTGAALWRREPLLALGGWKEDQPCCQEHELYARALRKGLRFRFCPTPGAVYRVWSESTVSRQSPRQLVQVRSALIDDVLAWLAATGRLQPSHRAAAGQVFLELARTLARYDLRAATEYYARRAREGKIALTGPAAPRSFRWAVRSLGFRRAEQIAAWRRIFRRRA